MGTCVAASAWVLRFAESSQGHIRARTGQSHAAVTQSPPFSGEFAWASLLTRRGGPPPRSLHEPFESWRTACLGAAAVARTASATSIRAYCLADAPRQSK